jgi:hypothetical protein
MLGLKSRLSLQDLRRAPHASSIAQRPSRVSPDLYGLPGIREQRAREKRDRVYRRIYRVVMWAILLGVFFLIGYNTRLNATEATRRAEVVHELGWTRIAMLVPTGKRKCAMEWRENCLVCEFRMLSGTQKSTMC